MIPNATLILGPPGCGKTYDLIERIKAALREGTHPSRIAVISFTRKAIEEMVTRACAELNMDPKQFPHIRTSHATGYHALGLQSQDVMSKADYSEVGKLVALVFEGKVDTALTDGLATVSLKGTGADYLNVIDRARNRLVSLDQEYNEAGNRDLFFPKLVQLSEQLAEYKSTKGKFDFVDMIEQYVAVSEPPNLDYLFVDEAQDFTPLQWQMVRKMAEKSTHVLIAGDDDQAIHRWTGVDVKDFIQSAEKVVRLTQSYRIPKSVHRLATRISAQIQGRIEKEFASRDVEGSVQYVNHLDQIDFDQGSWTVMARINSYALSLAEWFQKQGYKYEIKGRPSIPEALANNLSTWEDLSENHSVAVWRVKKLYDALPKQGKNAAVRRGAKQQLEVLPDDGIIGYDELVRDFGLLVSIDIDPYDLLRVSDDMRRYINAIQRRGESLTSAPRIKVSTFHAMKGGEDDNCVVYTGSTHACVNSDYPDDEHRAFYVGVTRAKRNLYILQSDKKYRYEL